MKHATAKADDPSFGGFEVYPETAPPHWDEIACRVGGSLFHSTVWADYQQRINHLRPYFVLVRDVTGEEWGGAVAFFSQSRRPVDSWIVRLMVLPAHPFVRSGYQYLGD